MLSKYCLRKKKKRKERRREREGGREWMERGAGRQEVGPPPAHPASPQPSPVETLSLRGVRG